MKTVLLSAAEAARAAAAQLLEKIESKQNAVLACSAGDDELEVLRALAALSKEKGRELSSVTVFAACEFEGLARDDARSARSRIAAALAGCGVREEQLYTPAAEDCEGYDRAIEALGGLDLALLGLGINCRVGFNEPATPFSSCCHVQKLTEKSRRELAPAFGGEEQVPARGVTLGFQSLCFARDIVVIALGEERSEAVFNTLYGRDDSLCPGAFLQIPPNVTLYADPAAGAKL